MHDVTLTSCNVCATAFPASGAELFVKDGHSMVHCPRCGLVFRATLPTPAELDELYGTSYFGGTGDRSPARDGYLDYVGDAELHRVNARRRLARLQRFSAPGSLLDVGCAAGFFVDEASRAGWRAHGVDVAATMVAWGRERTAADLRAGTLRDLPADRPESCITMWDYIEHALDPRADLEAAFARLEPGGIVALSTGDVGSALARASLEHWHLMTPRHHNYFFTRATLGRLLESVGFMLEYVGRPAAVYPLRYLAHKACLTVRRGRPRRRGPPPRALAARGLGHPRQSLGRDDSDCPPSRERLMRLAALLAAYVS